MKPSGSCLESCSGTVARSKGWHLARKSFKAATSRAGSCWLSPASWNLSPKGREKSKSNLPQKKTTENPQRFPRERQGKPLACPLLLAVSNIRCPFKTSMSTRIIWLCTGFLLPPCALFPEALTRSGNVQCVSYFTMISHVKILA